MFIIDETVLGTFDDLTGVIELIAHFEASIPEMAQRARAKRKAQMLTEPDDPTLEMAEMESINLTYASIRENAGRAVIILLCSIIEVRLMEAAERVGKSKGIPFRAKELAGKVNSRSALYIERAIAIDVRKDVAWQTLHDLSSIRDIIVHRSGLRGETAEHQGEFDRLSRRYDVSDGDCFWLGEAFAISLEQCRVFAGVAREFFTRVFPNVGFPGAGIVRK